MSSGILIQRFIFINKSAQSSSLSQSDGDERRQIFTHVQNDVGKPRGTFVSTTPLDFEHKKQIQTTLPAARYLHERHCPLCIPTMDHFSSNGFQTLGVAVNGGMREKLAYYLDSVIDTIFPIRSVAAEARQHVFACATEDAAALFGLLSVVNASLFSLSHDVKYTRESVRYKGLALSQVRKRLNDGHNVNASTAFAIAQLLRVECGQGDYQAIKIHFDGLVKMMRLIDSPSNVPFPLMLGIQACLYLCAATIQTSPPVVNVACGPKGNIGGSVRDAIPIQKSESERVFENPFTSRFGLKSYKDFIGSTLIDIIGVSYELRSIRRYAEEKGLPLSPHQAHVLITEPLSLEQRLLSISFQVIEGDPLNAAREAIRLAFYLLSVPPVPISEPRNPFRASLAGQMRKALGRSNIRGLWAPCTDLLLWTVFIAASVSYHQDEWGWIVSHAALVCKELSITTFSSFQEALIKVDPTLDRFANLSHTLWLYMQECPID